MLVVVFLLAFLAFIGHAALWIGLANRVHSTGLPRRLVKSLSAPCHLLSDFAGGRDLAGSCRGMVSQWHNAGRMAARQLGYLPVLGDWCCNHRLLGSSDFQQSPPAAVRENTETIVDVAA